MFMKWIYCSNMDIMWALYVKATQSKNQWDTGCPLTLAWACWLWQAILNGVAFVAKVNNTFRTHLKGKKQKCVHIKRAQ